MAGSGQIGNNSTADRSTPVSVLGARKTFCKISNGYAAHAGAIDKNGLVWSWGDNQYGQLGDNSTISKRTPVSVLGARKTFCEITCGNNNTLVIDNRGLVWGWGYNDTGQLGNNLNYLTPIRITYL